MCDAAVAPRRAGVGLPDGRGALWAACAELLELFLFRNATLIPVCVVCPSVPLSGRRLSFRSRGLFGALSRFLTRRFASTS
jgi:hypothetical protein